MDDLQNIAIGKRHIGKRRARRDLGIVLHRNLLRVEAKAFDQIGNRRTGSDAAHFAIHGQLEFA